MPKLGGFGGGVGDQVREDALLAKVNNRRESPSLGTAGKPDSLQMGGIKVGGKSWAKQWFLLTWKNPRQEAYGMREGV